MILTREKFQKAKEKLINEGFMDDGSEKAQKCKLACLLIAETFIENWFLNNEENTDADEKEFMDFASVQLIALINSGLNQGQTEMVIKSGSQVLLAFILTVFDMYFEPNEVAGTC